MSTQDNITTRVEIPGQQTFWSGPIVPPFEVALPLAARARLPWLIALLIPIAITGLFATAVLVMLPFVTMSSQSAGSTAFLATAMAFVAAFGLICVAAIVTALADWGGEQPVLVVTAEGVQDRRSGAYVIAWSDVVRAQVVYQSPIKNEDHPFQPDASVFAVLLALRHAIRARHNPFRLGTLAFRWRRKPNELYVTLLHLSVSSHVLAYSMLALVRRHGGAIQPRLPNRDPGARR